MGYYPTLLSQALRSPQGQQLQANSTASLARIKPHYGGIYQAVPWRDWNDTTNTANLVGTRDYLGSMPYNLVSPSQRYQITNNTDSFLYISSTIAQATLLTSYPEAIIGPFSALNVTLQGTGLNMLARCCGYDFTTTRAVPGTFDVRFSNSSFVQVTPLGPTEDPALPVLRSSWARTYDLNDLTWNGNALPAFFTTSAAWYSNVMELSGASSVDIQAHATSNANTTSSIAVFFVANDPVTAQGAYNEGGGGGNFVNGHNYVQASLTYTSNRPRAEIFFNPGDTSGAHVVFDQVFVQAICHS
jgi:hypothetical protein